MNRDELSYVNISPGVYGAMVDGDLLGVLYYVADDGDGQCPESSYPWYWLPTNEPVVRGLSTPPVLDGMSQEQYEANVEIAMETVSNHLCQKTGA